MQTQEYWLNLFKAYKGLISDYRLARYWQIEPSRISQYRYERLRLPLAFILEIAEITQVNPLEIIISMEYSKARERDKDYLKDIWFCCATQTITKRMASNSHTHYRHWKNYWYRKR